MQCSKEFLSRDGVSRKKDDLFEKPVGTHTDCRKSVIGPAGQRLAMNFVTLTLFALIHTMKLLYRTSMKKGM